jgi:hypothetical protein
MGTGKWHGNKVSYPPSELPPEMKVCTHGEDAGINLAVLKLFLPCADCGGISLELEGSPVDLIEALQAMEEYEDEPKCLCHVTYTGIAVPQCPVHQDRINKAATREQ